MATPFVKESKRHQPLLDITHLVDVYDLLRNHSFSFLKYYDFGLYLGLLANTLDAIKENNRGDVRSCLRECLKAWLRQADNVMRRGGPTYDTLIKVLREMGENAVADGIEREKGVFESPPSSPPTKRHTVQPGELEIKDLVDILHLLEKHGYPSVSYYDFGLYLGLLPSTLDVIEANNSGDIEGCLRECLTAWLKQVDNVKSKGGPTYDTLIQALRKIDENAAADGIDRDLRGDIVPPTANPISTEDTPAADRIPDTQNPITESKIEKWLKEGEVELEITRINMHGAPGAGKTCTQCLLLNEPPPAPPDELTDSTPIVCPAVKATRISIDDKNKWERVKQEDLLEQLASRLNEAPNKTEHKRILREAPIPTNPVPVPLDDSSPKAELSEKGPPEKKPLEKKPTDMEVIKEIVSALEAGKFKQLSTNWVYFIDSGGQPAYRELLPLFTRAAALNIITIDLTKGLDEKFEFQYRFDQFEHPINQRFSNRDIIQSAVSSGAMFNPTKIPYVSESDKHKNIHPRYFILGTRKDKLEENGKLYKLNEMNKGLLKEYKANMKVITNRQDHDNIIYPVNTMLKGSEREEASVALCTKISSFGASVTIHIPIRLFAFEISLQREAKQKNQSFLTKEEVIEIGKPLQLDDESDIDKALQYLHNVTIILYYPAVLPNIIFVDPKPILDVLSLLIASTYTNRTEADNLRILGLFNEDLLQLFGEEIFEHADFKSSHMIKLLRHLHIIAEAKNRKEGSYFFPCALQSCKKLNPAPTEIQPLLIAWEIQNGGTKTLAIPQGLFPLTIVHLLEKKNIVQFAPDPDSDDETEFYRYHDAMSLRVFNEEYTIDIINRYTHIEIRFYDCKEFCPQIRELVMDAIKKSNNDLKVGKNHIFAFKCPRKNKQCYCIVKEDLSSTRCTQCRSHCKVLQGGDDSYRCWFSDCQSFSPGTKASLEDPPTKKHRLELSASDRFRRVSDRLAGSISSCLTTVSGKLNAKRLIAQELHDEMINGRDIDFKKAVKLVNAIQITLGIHSNLEAYLNEVCSALKDVGEEPITDIVNELEQ